MSRAIDHLVLAVRDLDAAGAFYERMGFVVGARNRHPWGTENRLVQFDGSFIELITVGPKAKIAPHRPGYFSFGTFVNDTLKRREGFAMLVLSSSDAKADARQFAKAGIGDFKPFFFDRRARRPDGSATHVAFTLAFGTDALAPQAGFFVCQQHNPENFWNAAFQQHANGAVGIASVAMVADNPTDHHMFLSAFTGERELHASSLGISVALARGHVDVVTPSAAFAQYGIIAPDEPQFVAFSIAVRDAELLKQRLHGADIPADIVAGRLVVAPAHAFGTAIAFEAAAR
jgi:catechol 2,3-dioxygenase-like lactoylglutathione lyase family enzyme